MSQVAVTQSLHFTPAPDHDAVSALLMRPASATRLLVFAHGAGAGMQHRFMESMSQRLGERGVATLRFNFPYMEHGRGRPNTPALLTATIHSAITTAIELAGDLPLFAGGKSMGGRMTSTLLSQESIPAVRGVIFFGFPLHAPGRAGDARGKHLFDVKQPMLFLQGTRDKLADLDLLRPICTQLGKRANLHVIEDADHSFGVLKRTGRSNDEVLDEIADVVAQWTATGSE